MLTLPHTSQCVHFITPPRLPMTTHAHAHPPPTLSSAMVKEVTCSFPSLYQHFCKDFGCHHCPTTSVFLPLPVISIPHKTALFLLKNKEDREEDEEARKLSSFNIYYQPLTTPLYTQNSQKHCLHIQSLVSCFPFPSLSPSTWHLNPPPHMF